MNDTTVTKMHLVCPHCNATNRVPFDKLQAELNCGKCHAALL
jgi:thioredoxin 2